MPASTSLFIQAPDWSVRFAPASVHRTILIKYVIKNPNASRGLRDGLLRGLAVRSTTLTLTPTFKISGTSVVLHPLEIVSIPVDQL
jgi:hypothetical protein